MLVLKLRAQVFKEWFAHTLSEKLAQAAEKIARKRLQRRAFFRVFCGLPNTYCFTNTKVFRCFYKWNLCSLALSLGSTKPTWHTSQLSQYYEKRQFYYNLFTIFSAASYSKRTGFRNSDQILDPTCWTVKLKI